MSASKGLLETFAALLDVVCATPLHVGQQFAPALGALFMSNTPSPAILHPKSGLAAEHKLLHIDVQFRRGRPRVTARIRRLAASAFSSGGCQLWRVSTESRNVPLFSQVGMTPVWFWVGGEGVGNAGDARHTTAP